MERLQTGQDRSSTSKVIRLNTVPAGQRYAMVMPSYFSRLSMLNAKKPSPHHHDMQGKTILAFRRIVLYFRRHLAHLMATWQADAIPLTQVTASVQGWVNHVRYGNTVGLRKAVLWHAGRRPRSVASSHGRRALYG